MAKIRTRYVCGSCGEESIAWQGRCPACQEWNTLQPFTPKKTSGNQPAAVLALTPLDVNASSGQRLVSRIGEFDRVVGGGIVPGSVILLAGEPGIGKSTLLLQVAQAVSERTVIYFSGEESTAQVAGRARRLGMTPTFLFSNETHLPAIRAAIEARSPDVVIIDSIQTIYDETYPSTPGSLVQVRECALILQTLAKSLGVSMILVGHITKEGTVAGPKTLEHMVDVVLTLEGDPRGDTRILRGMKNRFGATYETGLFQLGENGMVGVDDPSVLFVESHRQAAPGTALTAVIEGQRPMLIEIQALVAATPFGYPKRASSGFDPQRLHLLLAILDSRGGGAFASSDVFCNVVGGYSVQDRGADLAACLALLSAASGVALPARSVFCGEVGLTGEIRPATYQKRRQDEINRLGYHVGAPAKTLAELVAALGLKVAGRPRGRTSASVSAAETPWP